jgi:hypothetical protein
VDTVVRDRVTMTPTDTGLHIGVDWIVRTLLLAEERCYSPK